jgi:hypothetical protein
LLECPSSWTNAEHIQYGLEYLDSRAELKDFVRDFDEPMGFSGSTHPFIGILYDALSREIDSSSSFCLYLRVLQKELQQQLAEACVNRCTNCNIDMGPDNPRQLCGKTI